MLPPNDGIVPRGPVRPHTDALLQGQVRKTEDPEKEPRSIWPEAGESAKDWNHPWVEMYSAPLIITGPC